MQIPSCHWFSILKRILNLKAHLIDSSILQGVGHLCSPSAPILVIVTTGEDGSIVKIGTRTIGRRGITSQKNCVLKQELDRTKRLKHLTDLLYKEMIKNTLLFGVFVLDSKGKQSFVSKYKEIYNKHQIEYVAIERKRLPFTHEKLFK